MKIKSNATLIKSLRTQYTAKDMRKVKRILMRQQKTHAKLIKAGNEVSRYSLLRLHSYDVVACCSWSSSRDFQAFMNMHSGRLPLTSVRTGCRK